MKLVAVLDQPINVLRGDSIQFSIDIEGKINNKNYLATENHNFVRFDCYVLTENDVKILEVDHDIYMEGYDESGNVVGVSQSGWTNQQP